MESRLRGQIVRATVYVRVLGRMLVLLLGWLVLETAGCATGPRGDDYPPVKMRTPRTGEVATCRAPRLGWDYQRQRDCVSDFQRQGWERVPD